MSSMSHFARFATCLATAVLWLTVEAPLLADVGLKTAVQVWRVQSPDQGSLQTTFDSPSAVSTALVQAWGQKKDEVCADIQANLGKSNGLGNGYTAYGINCTMADATDVQAAGGGPNRVTLSFKLLGNQLDFQTTQPSVFGSYADPRFDNTYDVKITVHVLVQNGTPLLKVEQAVGVIDNVQVRPGNVAADVLSVVVGFMQKGSFSDLAGGVLNGKKIDLTGKVAGALSAVGGMLQRPQGASLGGAFVRKGKVVLVWVPSFPVPTSGGASVDGTIRWQENVPADSPNTACNRWGLAAEIPAGPPPVLGADPAEFGATPQRAAGVLSIGGNAAAVAGHWECRYTILNLPAGVPARFHSTAVPVQNAKIIYALGPEGWNGVVAASASGKDWKLTMRPGTVMAVEKKMISKPGDPDPTKTKIQDAAKVQAVNPAVQAAPQVKPQ